MTNEERLKTDVPGDAGGDICSRVGHMKAASVLRFRHVDAPARFGELGSPQHAEIDPFKSGAA
jgi:hypothetical protein